MSRACKLLLVPICLFQAGFFLFLARRHLIDGDEGFYLLASQLVLQHKTPYVDFFYTQAPLLPYAYALWFKFTGISWFAARTFSGLQTAILGALIYEHVCHETGKWMAGVSAVVLFASSSLIFVWFPIVKTFPLATLFLFLAYLTLVRLTPSSGAWRYATVGLFFALSVAIRSYFIVIGPLLLYWILCQTSSKRRTHLLSFLSGFIVGIVPSLALFFLSPDAFLFDNLGYHAIRSSSGLIGDWGYKLKILLSLFGGRFTGFQLSLLTLTSILFVLVRRPKRDASLLAFLTALLLGFVSILPTPAYIQYFSVIVPFLIVAAVCLISDYWATLRSQRTRGVAAILCAVLLVSFVRVGVQNFLMTDQFGRLKTQDDTRGWTLEQVTAVSEAINQMTVAGEPVASFWPGYIFTSSATPYPGFENNFGPWVGYKLSPQKRQKYHILAESELIAVFARHGPRIAVVGNQAAWNGGPEYFACVKMLQAYGYFLSRTVGDTWIFECCTKTP